MLTNNDDLIGVTLKQNYTIKKVLGRGGMSVVYLALQANMAHYVAIKVPKGPIDDHRRSAFLERFGREVNISGKFQQHPHIIGAYDCGEHNGLPYLTFSHKFNRVTARPVARPKKDLVCLASCLGCIQAHPSQPASQGTLLGTLKLWLKVSYLTW